jgi:hypothetical protein
MVPVWPHGVDDERCACLPCQRCCLGVRQAKYWTLWRV